MNVENCAEDPFVSAVNSDIVSPVTYFKTPYKVVVFGVANGMFDSILRQAIDGEFSLEKTVFGWVAGGLTGGLFRGAGKLLQKSMPYVKTVLEDVK